MTCLRAWIRVLADAGEVTGWEEDIVQRKLVMPPVVTVSCDPSVSSTLAAAVALADLH